MEAAPDPVSLVMCKDSAKTLWSRTLGQVNEDKGYIYIHMGYIMICRDNQKKYLRNICTVIIDCSVLSISFLDVSNNFGNIFLHISPSSVRTTAGSFQLRLRFLQQELLSIDNDASLTLSSNMWG
jgi:hypothetical protein